MRRRWMYKNASMVTSSPAEMNDGGIVYGTRNGSLVTLDPEGVKRWSFQANGPIEAGATIHPTGLVLFGCYDGLFRAVNSEGKLAWSLDVGFPVMTTPCVDGAGQIWFGDDGGVLHCVSSTGLALKKSAVADLLSSSPVCHDGVVYVSDQALIGTDGSRVSLAKLPTVAPGALGREGQLYVGSWDGVVRCVRNGRVEWEHFVGGQIYGGCSVDPEGRVFVGTRSGQVVAISAAGERVWTRTLKDGVYGTPALSRDGLCFVGSSDRFLYALSRDTGEIRWRERCGRELRSSVLLMASGLVVVSCWDYGVYAFDGGGGGPCVDCWPQFHRTSARLGRY